MAQLMENRYKIGTTLLNLLASIVGYLLFPSSLGYRIPTSGCGNILKENGTLPPA